MATKTNGNCPHCGATVMRIEVLNIFDTFSIKCWQCKKITKGEELKFIKDTDPIRINENGNL